jgi:hypothetical protein
MAMFWMYFKEIRLRLHSPLPDARPQPPTAKAQASQPERTNNIFLLDTQFSPPPIHPPFVPPSHILLRKFSRNGNGQVTATGFPTTIRDSTVISAPTFSPNSSPIATGGDKE